MTTRIITAPAAEPVSLAEARAQCRVTHTDEDSLISLYISTAREVCEQITGRALITQTLEKTLDAFPDAIRLDRPPCIAVTGVYYVDSAGVEQTLAGAGYFLDNVNEPAWIVPAVGADWPDTYDRANAVRVRYQAGYGASATNVPAALRQWILLAVEKQWNDGDLPRDFVPSLLDRFRITTGRI